MGVPLGVQEQVTYGLFLCVTVGDQGGQPAVTHPSVTILWLWTLGDWGTLVPLLYQEVLPAQTWHRLSREELALCPLCVTPGTPSSWSYLPHTWPCAGWKGLCVPLEYPR